MNVINNHLIDDVSFVHNHDLAVRYYFFQMIREQFPADVDSFDGRVPHLPLAYWNDVREGKSRINDQRAQRLV